jgi:lysophospholipase L1-like esterase
MLPSLVKIMRVLRLIPVGVITVLSSCGTAPHAALTTLPSAAPDPSTRPEPAGRAGYLADIRTLLNIQWPKNRTVNIVCHGHSVPAGYFRTPLVRSMDAYPHLLHAALCDAFRFARINVIVTAIGGENAESGAARFDRDVLSLRPDVVTIDYALNDRAIGLERAEKAWRTMIEKALAAKAKVILLTPTPDKAAKLDDPTDPLHQHADQIRRLAAEYHIGLVDSLGIFKQAIRYGVKLDDLMAQSNHPNRRGHELVARELERLFEEE